MGKAGTAKEDIVPDCNQTRSSRTLHAPTSEVDEETIEGPHLHNYRSWTHVDVAMGPNTSRKSCLPLCAEPECGPLNEMSTGCRPGGEESCTNLAIQRVLPGGSGFSR